MEQKNGNGEDTMEILRDSEVFYIFNSMNFLLTIEFRKYHTAGIFGK